MSASKELFELVRNSRLSQVAKPHANNIRLKTNKPTHQVIFTPSTSAYRSNYGLKSVLPGKIGKAYISFNDIDNKKGMPDVEKNSGFHYTQQMFQEMGVPLKNHFTKHNPLFPHESNQSSRSLHEGNLTSCFNIDPKTKTSDVINLLNQNPRLYKNFRTYVSTKHPQVILTSLEPFELTSIMRQFLNESKRVKKKENTMANKLTAMGERNNSVQGTGGFSYNQRGRLQNTPNGIKHHTIVDGRMVGTKEAAIGGVVANVIDRSIALQLNYARNTPGAHYRQFTVPLKVNEAEFAEDGSIRMFAEGIKSGTWSETDERYLSTRNSVMGGRRSRGRAGDESLESLLNLILPGKR
ncbi:mitochondrial 37S ribosomal protein bS1m [Lodderomyces beijingensis]|uniref:Uncharacterized protein n=1 Tax=Lodderomyces beijingensis TaxID=1775926 RepID=A0ABP0ZDD4_9ASCO